MSDEQFPIIKVPGPGSHLDFLRTAGKQGCLSGRVTEWPQLKPAMAWAFDRITALEARCADLEKTATTARELQAQAERANLAKLDYMQTLEERCAEAEGDMHGCLIRWREALERPYPAVGVMREPAESLYRATEKIRAERDAIRDALAIEQVNTKKAEAERDAAVKRAEEAEGINRRHSTRQLEAERLATKERHHAEKAEADLARIRAAVESEEMVEKVAAAIHGACPRIYAWEELSRDGERLYKQEAKAALAAVREVIQ